MTVVHAGPPTTEGRRNSIGASFRKGLEKISLLPGGRGAFFGRSPSSAGQAQQPGSPGVHIHRVQFRASGLRPALLALPSKSRRARALAEAGNSAKNVPGSSQVQRALSACVRAVALHDEAVRAWAPRCNASSRCAAQRCLEENKGHFYLVPLPATQQAL